MTTASRLVTWALLAAAAVAPAAAGEREDFRAGAGRWRAGPVWSVGKNAAGRPVYVADAPGDAFSWRPDWRLGRSWTFSATVRVAQLKDGGDQQGLAGLAVSLDAANPGPTILATLTCHKTKLTLVDLDYYQDGRWHKLLRSGWLPGGDREYELELSRQTGDDFLRLSVTGDRGLRYCSDSPPAPLGLLNRLACPGLRAYAARDEYSAAAYATPSPDLSFYRTAACDAVEDLLRHFWTGDAAGGYVTPTWNGYPAKELPDPRGGLWDRTTLLFVLDSLYCVTHDPGLIQRIASDWRRTKQVYSAADLDTPGTSVNPGCDDSGWNARGYLVAYRATGDPEALRHAAALVDNSFRRWLDDKLGGAMWYNDQRSLKSLYQVGVVLDALEIAGAGGDAALAASLREHAMACYEWMEAHLLRPDGLYWCDRGASGPAGVERPDDIHEAGSVTFLGGDMGMAVLHARLFRTTHDDKYRQRALRTADAILARLTDGRGVLLDERDAWANGTFAGEWAREVLTLPGIPAELREVALATARAVYVRDRTPDGYYGGCWNGPADGPGSKWSALGSRPQQIMTSTNAVCMIVAGAAVAEGR